MFKEEINIDKNKITITVSIEQRSLAIQEKLIYSEDPSRLIPEEYSGKFTLKEFPVKKVSNMVREKYTNTGIWVYEIEQKQEKASTTRTTRTRRTRTTTKQKKIDKNK